MIVCDNDLTDKELFEVIPNSKSAGNDELTRRVDLSKKALSTFQRQAVIKLIEKKILIKPC